MAAAREPGPNVTVSASPPPELRLAPAAAPFEARRVAGLATLIATHSEALARRVDRILRLKDGAISHE